MLALTLALSVACADPLTPGNHLRSLHSDGRTRSYHVHVPPQYDATAPTPVVLAYHGLMTNGLMMAGFSGLNKKADEAGFVVVYPNGNGSGNLMLFWNAGGMRQREGEKADDVAFTARLLDDLATLINIDPKRVYATGLSNGGMMCYRLAAELSDRIAAIAPVAGTMAIDEPAPKRPVPVIHFHGTEDTFVPFGGSEARAKRFIPFKSVDETMRLWAKIDGCPEEPMATGLPDSAEDGTTVTRKIWGPGKEGAEVVLYTVTGGGHTWPGMPPIVKFLGKSTKDISANDLMWEFFQKHPLE
ncbi:MAG: alpha/beta hydrolase family esterase [Deltaproteobacteria bacterium]